MIKIAAIKVIKNNNEIIVSGKRHSDCYEILSRKYNIPFASKNYYIEEGFLTNDDKFVDRYEAYLIAIKNNQLISNTTGPSLYSEDIY